VDIKLTLPEIERITWELLEEHPDVRPTMAEVAAVRGGSPLQIRRANERIQRIVGSMGYCAKFRDVLTYSCITYAQLLIRQGIKISAAMRIAGFRQRTNFNRQYREFLGELPRESRSRAQNVALD
jgi:methylphosphotriester-DNA--protein-cysteine methyltransferase